MSGHSKWSQIKRQKGVVDQKRGQVFSKMAKAISAAARTGQGLDLLVERARAENMPKENIDRAIARGQGKIEGVQIEEAIYEAYGPEGVAIIIKVLTDNKNRAISSIRAILNRFGGRLAESGSVAYLFEEKGVIIIDPSKQPIGKEDIEMIVIDSGVEDFEEDQEIIYAYTKPKKLEEAKKFIEFKAIKTDSAKVEMIPKTYVQIAEDKKAAVIKLLEALEEDQDIDEVYTNADL